MSLTEELVHDLVDLHIAGRDSDWDRVRRVEERVLDRVGEGVPKAVAARVLDVGMTTLNSWIAHGRVEAIEGKNGRQLVATRPLVELAAQTGQED